MPPKNALETQSILDEIRRLVEAVRNSVRDVEKKLGISGAQLYVLQKLSEEPGLSMNELAERTLTHQSSVSVVVTRLEEKGLVARKKSPSDGRRLEIHLTASGKKVVAKAPSPFQAKLIGAIECLSSEQRKGLAKTLRALNANAGFGGQAAPLFFERNSE